MPRSRTVLPPVRPDGLQLAEHRPFQEAFWTAERIAWGGFGVVLVLALSGLTGSGGPWSQATLHADAASLTYPRVSRWSTADTVTVAFQPAARERSLTLSPEFTAAFQIETIRPEPARAEATPAGTRMTFAAEQGGTVALHVRAFQPGRVRFDAALDGGQPQRATSFVLP